MSLAALERAATSWTRWLALAAGWLLLGLALVTVADALLRKLLSRPIQGTFEATELLLGVVIFWALPYTGLTDGHVVLDLFTTRLSARAQAVIIGLNALLVAVFLGFVARELSGLAETYGRTARTTITMRIPVYPFALAIMAAAWLATIAALVQALVAFSRAASPGAESGR